MVKNNITFVIDKNGEIIKSTGTIRALSNFTTSIIVVAPFPQTNAIITNYLIFEKPNIKDLYDVLKITQQTGRDFINVSDNLFEKVKDWPIWRLDISSRPLTHISKYRAGKIGLAFSIYENDEILQTSTIEVAVDPSLKAEITETISLEEKVLIDIAELQGNVSELNQEKLDKNWEDYTEELKLELNDFIILNRSDVAFKSTIDAIKGLLISDINKSSFQIISSIEEVIYENVIYLIPKSDTTDDNNIYEQWILVNGKPESIGLTSIDLAKYYTKEEVDELDRKLIKLVGDLAYDINNQLETKLSEDDEFVVKYLYQPFISKTKVIGNYNTITPTHINLIILGDNYKNVRSGGIHIGDPLIGSAGDVTIGFGAEAIESLGGATALGSSAKAKRGGTSLGSSSYAERDAVAVGSAAKVFAGYGMAIGDRAEVASTGFFGMAIGPLAKVSARGGLALGPLSEASGEDSIAIGNGTKNAVPNSVSFGLRDLYLLKEAALPQHAINKAFFDKNTPKIIKYQYGIIQTNATVGFLIDGQLPGFQMSIEILGIEDFIFQNGIDLGTTLIPLYNYKTFNEGNQNIVFYGRLPLDTELQPVITFEIGAVGSGIVVKVVSVNPDFEQLAGYDDVGFKATLIPTEKEGILQ